MHPATHEVAVPVVSTDAVDEDRPRALVGPRKYTRQPSRVRPGASARRLVPPRYDLAPDHLAGAAVQAEHQALSTGSTKSRRRPAAAAGCTRTWAVRADVDAAVLHHVAALAELPGGVVDVAGGVVRVAHQPT